MQVKDYFSETQNLLRGSAFIENVDVKYEAKSKTVGLIHVFRYDNAPHHPEVPTYPHHKHIRDEEKVKQSKEIGLRDALSEIEGMIIR